MSSLVIVSSHCYLLCESIQHISMDIWSNDEYEINSDLSLNRRYHPKPRKAKSKTAKEKEQLEKIENAIYRISINFMPVGGSNNNNPLSKGNYNSGDGRCVQFLVQGQKKAEGVYKEIVNQIREQIPDQVYLDKLVDKLLQE